MRLQRLILINFPLAALALLAAPVSAQTTCTGDSDCSPGLVCEIVGGTACATMVCPPGVDCPPPEPCEPEDIYGCVPGPCEKDADCGDDLVCVTVSYDACPPIAMPDCAPGVECPLPPPVECEPVSESFCAPRYVGPCEVDSDCGDRFTCAEAEECFCSGSSGGGSMGGEPLPPPPPDGDGGGEEDPPPMDEGDTSCGCEPSGTFYCKPDEISCAADGECPDGWSCLLSMAPVACTIDSESGISYCDDPPDTTDGFCAPPYWDEGFGVSRGESTPPALSVAAGSDDAQATGFAEAGGGGAEAGASGGGCQAVPGTAQGLLGLPWLAGIFLFLRRRRSRA